APPFRQPIELLDVGNVEAAAGLRRAFEQRHGRQRLHGGDEAHAVVLSHRWERGRGLAPGAEREDEARPGIVTSDLIARGLASQALRIHDARRARSAMLAAQRPGRGAVRASTRCRFVAPIARTTALLNRGARLAGLPSWPHTMRRPPSPAA